MTIIEVARMFKDNIITGACPKSHWCYGSMWFSRKSMDIDFLTWKDILDDWAVTSLPEEEWE